MAARRRSTPGFIHHAFTSEPSFAFKDVCLNRTGGVNKSRKVLFLKSEMYLEKKKNEGITLKSFEVMVKQLLELAAAAQLHPK